MVSDGVIVRVVVGEAAGVVAAYVRAVSDAERVCVLLVAAEVDLHAVLVVPGLTEAGEPVVYLTALTDSARQRLARILRSGAGPPPPEGPRGRG
ncbi:MAG TPA: hypothetical protein VGJ13_03770 [Pseudonocardiaceae bacterium]